MALVYEPRYILRLDELPKVVEADDTVYPVFLRLRDTARLFGVNTTSIMRWHEHNGLPILRFGGDALGRGAHVFIEIAKLNDWIRANSAPHPEYKERGQGV